MPQSHPGEQDFLFAIAPDTRCPEGNVGLYRFEQSRAIFMPYVCKVPVDTLAYLWEELAVSDTGMSHTGFGVCHSGPVISPDISSNATVSRNP